MNKQKIKKPSLFRRLIMNIVYGWRRVMDVRYNPLKYVPDPSLQTYFMLVLFTVWSIFFGLVAANYLGFFNFNIVASVIIHIAIILPLAFTNAVFVDAERDGDKWLKEWKEEQSRYKLVVNRLKTKNLVIWNPNNEA
jgi:hypothetical protein|tara:strand:- start:502 stop:912 length:411 start_codon:yes stop_codon:yes gene_type:complete